MATGNHQSTVDLPVASSFAELLELGDHAFIASAYATVLCRRPDPVGAAGYARLLFDGHGKIEVLRRLRSSIEGRRQPEPFPKFDARMRWQLWARLPVVGYVVALVAPVDGRWPRQRASRRMEARVERIIQLLEQGGDNMRSSAPSFNSGSTNTYVAHLLTELAG